MDIKKVGVVGAGQMGTGIAHVCALAGLEVTIQDLSLDQLSKSVEAIDRTLDRQVSKQKLWHTDLGHSVRLTPQRPPFDGLTAASGYAPL